MKGLESKTYGKIKPYGYRGFESPLVFFRTNIPEYVDKGRRQLSLDYPGVYRALLRWEELETAIPIDLRKENRGRHPLPNEEAEKILCSYDMCDGNAMRVARFLGYSRTTVLNYWKLAGLK